ncbi:MAG TPA: DUF952 domain-containing protein [Polyangiaceae bacterium]|jgi:uncharacterized protein (DUF952 family)|nr:DUF952 domain-containing protein [Polyangiaceae bacterium]
MSDAHRHVFHITERGAFSAALEAGSYAAGSLEREGFIHCSTRAQIRRTAARFFGGRTGLVLLCIDAARIAAQLRYEAADGEAFPHCYGAIPLEAIPAVIDFPCRSDGSFDLPPELELFAD